MCDSIGIILRDVLYAPNICKNLISVSTLESKVYEFRFCKGKVTIGRNKKVLIKGIWVDGL